MRVAHSILVVLAAFALSSSLTVPVEDLPETPCDESEALPYESTRFFSITQPPAISVGNSVLRFEFSCEPRRKLLAEQSRLIPPRIGVSIHIVEHSLRC